MNVDKSMMKVDLAKLIGRQYAEMESEARKSELRQQGARDALKEAAKAVGDLGLKLDQAFEDGELTPAMLKDPKQVEIFIKKWNRRAVGALDNLATRAEMARIQAVGRAKGLKAAEQYVEGLAKAEVTRLEKLHRQIESGEITLEEVRSGTALVDEPGGHPGLSLKHRREDEEAAKEEASAQTEAPEQTEPVETTEKSGTQEETEAETKAASKKTAKARPKKKPAPRKRPAPKKKKE